MIIFSALLMVVVMAIDTLACGFAYGTSNIKVAMRHLVVINIIGSALLSASLIFGLYISKLFLPSTTEIISCIILMAVGTYKLIGYFRNTVKETQHLARQIKWSETIIIAFALSFDNIAIGLGISIHNASVIFCITVIAFALITDFVLFLFGNTLGKITKKSRLDLSWLSGAVLIILGAIKFI